MRSAIVVLPVCASLAAGALLAFQLRTPPRPAAPTVVIAPLPVVAAAAAPPARYQRAVGGQFLDSNVLLAYPDMPPALLDPHTGDDAYRFEWRYQALAIALAREAAAVIDDACPQGSCAQAHPARQTLESWLEAGEIDETHELVRSKTDDPVAPTYRRRLTMNAWAGAMTLHVECTATSDYLGMNGWNDAVTCDATLRDHGRRLLTYEPRRQTALDRGTWLVERDAWDQRVAFETAELVTHTGNQPARGPIWRTLPAP